MPTPRTRFLAPMVSLLALLICIAPARAGDFRAGTYTFRDKDGTKGAVVNFTADPKAPTRFNATGWVGSIVQVPIKGLYTTKDNRFTGNWMPISIGDLPSFGLSDLRGEWSSTSDVFYLRHKGGPPMPLKFDASEPDPNAPKITIKSVDLEPAVNGALLKGRVTLGVVNLKYASSASLSLAVLSTVEGGSMNAIDLEIPGDGDHVVDLSRVPTTVAAAGDMTVIFRVQMPSADPGEVEWKRTVPAAGLTRPVTIFGFASHGSARVHPKEIGKLGWVYSLSSSADATGRKLRIEVTESVTIYSTDRPADILKCQPTTRMLECSPEGVKAPVQWLQVAELLPGLYTAVVRIESPDLQTFNGVIPFLVDAPSRNDDGGEADTEPAAVSGTAGVAPASIKPKGKAVLSVRFGYDKGPDAADVDAEFELTDPKGNIAKRVTKRVELRQGKPADFKFDVTSDIPGVHTVKARVSGSRCSPWETTATFTVEKPDAPSGQGAANPPGNQQGNAAQQGTFGLVKVVVGKAPDPGDGPYGTMTGSISQNACSFRYVMKAPYEGTWSAQASFGTPPAMLKPGEIIELACSGSASESGKDLGAMGIGCFWLGEGSCEAVEVKKFYVGRASDGKFHPSGQGLSKIRIESGGKIKITAVQGGQAWGNGGIWNPAEYHYEWNAPPIEPGGDAGKPKDEEEQKGATLTSTDPDDDTPHQINAWLDPGALTLYAGEIGKIVSIHIERFRTDTVDRIEVLFPQKSDNWASLPGQIVVTGGDGSYDPANMGRPVHVDGYFFSARITSPGGAFEIEVIVRQAKAGFVRLKLPVRVVARPPRPDDPAPTPTTGPAANPLPPPPPNARWPQGDTSGSPRDFSGRWATNLGTISLTQRGNAVEGTYPGGVVNGNVAGSVLTLRMDERAMSPYSGYGRWVLNASGDEFTGGWTTSPRYGPPVNGWSGRKTTTGGASPHIMDPRGAQPTGTVTNPDGKPPSTGTGATGPTGAGAQPKPGTLDLSPAGFPKQGWTSEGAGASVKVEGDRLVFDVPKASEGGAESFSPTPLDGDFDISIDYEHIDWASRDELSLSWSVFLSPVPHTESRELIQVMRTSGDGGRGFGDLVINASSKSEPQDVRALTDKTGTLRVARAGNTVRIYQKLGDEWRQAAVFETALPGKLHLGFVLERQGDGGAKVSLRPRPTR